MNHRHGANNVAVTAGIATTFARWEPIGGAPRILNLQ